MKREQGKGGGVETITPAFEVPPLDGVVEVTPYYLLVGISEFELPRIGRGRIVFFKPKDLDDITSFATPAGKVPFTLQLEQSFIVSDNTNLPIGVYIEVDSTEKPVDIKLELAYKDKVYKAIPETYPVANQGENRYRILFNQWIDKATNKKYGHILFPPDLSILQDINFAFIYPI